MRGHTKFTRLVLVNHSILEIISLANKIQVTICCFSIANPHYCTRTTAFQDCKKFLATSWLNSHKTVVREKILLRVDFTWQNGAKVNIEVSNTASKELKLHSSNLPFQTSSSSNCGMKANYSFKNPQNNFLKERNRFMHK